MIGPLQGVKCSVIDCARDATSRYAGRSKPGRLPEDEARGVPYCKAHYHQVQRTGKTKPLLGKTRPNPYHLGIDAAAELCEFHGHPDLAEIVRGLK